MGSMEPQLSGFFVSVITGNAPIGFTLVSYAGALLLLWRLYRFTIVPYLYPNEPKEYPYWIPVVGHLRSFFKNSSQLLSESRRYFKNARVPYGLTVGGQKWYIITSPEDVTSIYKIHDNTCSYDIFVEAVMGALGISKDGVKKVYQTGSGPGDKENKHLARLSKEYHTAQLSPGTTRFNELVNPTVASINAALDFDALVRARHSTGVETDAVSLSLYDFVSDVFIRVGQEGHFGKSLGKIDPDLIETFKTFDANAWQVLYQYPSFLCGPMLAAKFKIFTALKTWMATPAESRSDAAWMILELEKDMTRLAMSDDDKALIFFQLYWSACGNNKKGPFWMLAHLLFDPALLAAIRAEIAPTITATSIDTEHLLASCPLLNAVWDETLRQTAFTASVRYLTADVVLPNSPVVLRAGNRIMMPQRQLHYDESIFGADARTFDAERFLKNPKLRTSGSYRPFGGGTTLCPGRHLAKVACLAFVAGLVGRFDVRLEDEGQGFPEPAEEYPTITLVDIRPGTDLRVVVRRRDLGA